MKRFLSVLLVILTGILLVCCGPKKVYSGTVMVYSSLTEDELQSIKEAFEKKYQGVTMDYYFSDTSSVIERLELEASTGQVNADVVIFKNAEDMDRFRLSELLADYTSKNAKKSQDVNYIGQRMGLLKDCLNEENGKLLIDFVYTMR